MSKSNALFDMTDFEAEVWYRICQFKYALRSCVICGYTYKCLQDLIDRKPSFHISVAPDGVICRDCLQREMMLSTLVGEEDEHLIPGAYRKEGK